MDSQVEDKVFSAISPATAIDNISLDYSGTCFFSELYDHNNHIIGAGVFGIVILAIDKQSHEERAIKILNINKYLLLDKKSENEQHESLSIHAARNFSFLKNEVNIMQSLAHKNIIKLVKIHKSLDHVLIVMEKAKGSLSDYIKLKGGKLSEEECKFIIREILEGLRYLHSLNVVHRDMKPGNILLMSFDDFKNTIKITDFSISANLTDALPYELIETAGTFLYKAPEQFTGAPCDTRTDMWAVGIMLYEMLTGKHPFYVPGYNQATYVGTIQNLSHQISEDLPEYAANFFYHLCHPKSGYRYDATVALEHPWLTGKGDNICLSFDEVFLLKDLKFVFAPVFFAGYCAANKKETKKKTYSHFRPIASIGAKMSDLSEAKQRVERRKGYEKRRNLKIDDQKAYETIFGLGSFRNELAITAKASRSYNCLVTLGQTENSAEIKNKKQRTHSSRPLNNTITSRNRCLMTPGMSTFSSKPGYKSSKQNSEQNIRLFTALKNSICNNDSDSSVGLSGNEEEEKIKPTSKFTISALHSNEDKTNNYHPKTAKKTKVKKIDIWTKLSKVSTQSFSGKLAK